jgi:hypothetical protein
MGRHGGETSDIDMHSQINGRKLMSTLNDAFGTGATAVSE